MDPIVVDRTNQPGWIEVVCGSMFSGKTEELIRRLKRARIARQHVEIFKPAIDARFSETDVVSHDENVIVSTPVDSAHQIILLSGAAQVIGIDEAQFFGTELVEVCRQLAVSGKRVIVAGLDQDFLANPFEPIPQLMAIAEYVTKLHAICVVCGSPANHSQRLVADSGLVVVGAAESYEPRCRRCFDPELATRKVEENLVHLSSPTEIQATESPSTPQTEKKSEGSEHEGPPVRHVTESTGLEGEENIPGWTQLNTAASPQSPPGQASTEGDGFASDAVDLSGGLPG